MERVRARDSKLDSIRRLDYEEYVIPYKKSFDFVLSTYPATEQQIIKEVGATDNEDRRKELIALERAPSEGEEHGTRIVSAFRSELTDFRQRMRLLDPELDARLILWEGNAAIDERGLEAWRRLRTRYGFVPQLTPQED